MLYHLCVEHSTEIKLTLLSAIYAKKCIVEKNQVLYHTILVGGEIDYIHLNAQNKWSFLGQLFMPDIYTDDHRGSRKKKILD